MGDMLNKITALLLGVLLLFATAAHAEQPHCPRIVSQAPYLTKTLQWLGLEQCIIGVSRYDTLDLPHTGGLLDPDADAISVLRPDLVITSNWTSAENAAKLSSHETRVLRLDGFVSMAQVEDNLRQIGNAVGMRDIDERVAQFHQQWKTAAHQIKGGGKHVLLLSSCSGSGYSFGKERWLSDLFTAAGFINVETEPKIRTINPSEEIPTLNALIDQLHPDLLFIFERNLTPQCALIKPKRPIRIITLDGEKFLHPAPVVLEGLKELAQHQNEWSQ